MTYLLSVYTSTRAEHSWSNRVLHEFEKQFVAEHANTSVRERFTGDIPHLDGAAQQAGRTPLDGHSPGDSAAFALANELTDELLNASALAIATPMYNWGPPSSLKAWLDRIINVKTFYQHTGVLSELPVTIIIASGGLYSEGHNSGHDFLRPLLTECFSRLGVRDLSFIDCDPSGPLDNGRIDPNSPDSAYMKALGRIPNAVTRIRSM